jgi:CelD/BcsL family acetyltransferase involved in cellulose biosynthesis
LTAAHVPCDVRTRWHVGRLLIEHDWPATLARLSRKHRQRVASSLRKLAARGEVQFELYQQLGADELEPLLRRFLAVEDRSWKGKAGTSILRTPGAADFMLQQARWLAEQSQLWLAFLRCGGRDVAACYQILGKSVLHSFKIGYDEDFDRFSPGHLLHYHLLEAIHADRSVQAVDYIGAMTEYHASWRPETYPFARLAFSPQGKLLGRAALRGYQWLKGPTEEMCPEHRLCAV